MPRERFYAIQAARSGESMHWAVLELTPAIVASYQGVDALALALAERDKRQAEADAENEVTTVQVAP